MFIQPVTDQDFAKLGIRHATADLVDEIDRLLPFAKRDAAGLQGEGFLPSEYTTLAAYRDDLGGLTAQQQIGRAARKSATGTALGVIVQGKTLLRRAENFAENLLSKRTIPAGETADQTHAVIARVHDEIHGLGGTVGQDSGKLRTRLGLVAPLFADDALATTLPELVTARDALLAQVASTLATLPKTEQAKSTTRTESQADNEATHVLQGKAYWLLTQLTRSGRTYWNAQHDHAHAADYQLNKLHSEEKQSGGTPPAPVGTAAPTAPAAS